VRNKTKTGTSQASSSDGIHPVCFEGNRLSLLFCSLPEDAYFLVHNIFAATGGKQKKDVMSHCAQFYGQFLDFGYFIIFLRNI